ncbi:hypothetical protein APSETT445_003377 [Aspergillus pseudonomiae]
MERPLPALGVKSEKEPSKTAFTDHPPQEYDGEGRDAADGPFLSPRIAAYVKRFENQLIEYNLEARGIERVQQHERMKRLTWVSYLQAFLLWVSINLAANNITLGMLGPVVYGLSFLDSALCAVLGALVGALVAAWMATWGPVSGVRTMIIVVSILYAVSSSKFDLSTPSSGDPRTLAGNRLSFFSICLSAAITYAPLAGDFFVYYPERTSRVTLFSLSLVGLIVSFTMAFLVGIGLASGISSHPEYGAAYSRGAGALIVEGFGPLHGFGKFCSVVVALGLIANTIPPTYSAGVDFQVLGRYAEKVPRAIWNTIGVIIYTVCALVGRSNLSDIFTNFLALMGYWVAIWIAIILEERFIFRFRTGYNWSVWNDPSKLPVGIAAFVAFAVGWVGAILCMAQVWYIGPLSRLVGEYGADMGNYVGFTWAGLVYPPLRYVELRMLGR